MRIAISEDDFKFIVSKIQDNKELLEKLNKQIEREKLFNAKRQKSALRAVEIKKEIAKEKVFKAIEILKKSNKKINSVTVIELAGVSKTTALKYLREYKKQ